MSTYKLVNSNYTRDILIVVNGTYMKNAADSDWIVVEREM